MPNDLTDDLFGSPAPAVCQHPHRKFTPTPHLNHHGREDCLDCGRFVRWVPKPQTIDRVNENTRRIAVLKTKQLSEWEKGFVASLDKQAGRFSPKQQAALDKLFARHEKDP